MPQYPPPPALRHPPLTSFLNFRSRTFSFFLVFLFDFFMLSPPSEVFHCYSRMNSMRIRYRYRAGRRGCCTPAACFGIFFRLQIWNLVFALRFRPFRPFLVHMGISVGCWACSSVYCPKSGTRLRGECRIFSKTRSCEDFRVAAAGPPPHGCSGTG
jgi:hypothetical protein